MAHYGPERYKMNYCKVQIVAASGQINPKDEQFWALSDEVVVFSHRRLDDEIRWIHGSDAATYFGPVVTVNSDLAGDLQEAIDAWKKKFPRYVVTWSIAEG